MYGLCLLSCLTNQGIFSINPDSYRLSQWGRVTSHFPCHQPAPSIWFTLCLLFPRSVYSVLVWSKSHLNLHMLLTGNIHTHSQHQLVVLSFPLSGWLFFFFFFCLCICSVLLQWFLIFAQCQLTLLPSSGTHGRTANECPIEATIICTCQELASLLNCL